MKQIVLSSLKNKSIVELKEAVKNKACIEVETEDTIYIVPAFGGG